MGEIIPLPSSSSSSSSSSSTPLSLMVMKHDVFLSFRGEDTRNNFTGHLYYALRHQGIRAFIDIQLKKGEEISPSLSSAIQQSLISIVVFSDNYASSAWCLDELVKIMECRESSRQLVWPIFFNVEPSHVRNQTGSFGEALAMFEADSTGKYKEKLPKWKTVLNEAGNLSGWHIPSCDGDESHQIIEKVVEASVCKLRPAALPLLVDKYPVGIRDHLQVIDLGSLINVGDYDLEMLDIYGIGGIGKRSSGKTVLNNFANEFQSSNFLANVGETSNQYCGGQQVHKPKSGANQLLHGLNQSSRIIRVSRASGLKDRHSKVFTAKGLRDRRVRLSAHTAIQFYDILDRLGYDRPSKAVEWLILASRDALPTCSFPDATEQLSDKKRPSVELKLIDLNEEPVSEVLHE